jgi:hypothetical protein
VIDVSWVVIGVDWRVTEAGTQLDFATERHGVGTMMTSGDGCVLFDGNIVMPSVVLAQTPKFPPVAGAMSAVVNVASVPTVAA